MVKYGNRRKAEKVLGILASIGMVAAMGALFFVWVIVMACM